MSFYVVSRTNAEISACYEFGPGLYGFKTNTPGLDRSMGNGCWSVSSSIICPQKLFPWVQIQVKVSLAQSEIQLGLSIFYYVFVRKIH